MFDRWQKREKDDICYNNKISGILHCHQRHGNRSTVVLSYFYTFFMFFVLSENVFFVNYRRESFESEKMFIGL